MGDRTFVPTPLADIVAPRRSVSRTPTLGRGRPGEPKPLWAILGDEPPYDWRPPDAEEGQVMEFAAAQEAPGGDRAPEPGSRSNPEDQRGPGVWVVEHGVFPGGPRHTALEYVSENGDREWISGGLREAAL